MPVVPRPALFERFRPDPPANGPIETLPTLLEYAKADMHLSITSECREHLTEDFSMPSPRSCLHAVYTRWQFSVDTVNARPFIHRMHLSTLFLAFIIHIKALNHLAPHLDFDSWMSGYRVVQEKGLMAMGSTASPSKFEKRFYEVHCPELTYKASLPQLFEWTHPSAVVVDIKSSSSLVIQPDLAPPKAAHENIVHLGRPREMDDMYIQVANRNELWVTTKRVLKVFTVELIPGLANDQMKVEVMGEDWQASYSLEFLCYARGKVMTAPRQLGVRD